MSYKNLKKDKIVSFKRKSGTSDPESFYRFLDNLCGKKAVEMIVGVKMGTRNGGLANSK